MHFFMRVPSSSSLYPLVEIKITVVCLCPPLGEKQTFTHAPLLP